ncbi:MAG: hypothetical protein L3K03_01100 [Thermoplasmata archaeon]|nr:hypothetical protein [Thermoplasmata archaeon]
MTREEVETAREDAEAIEEDLRVFLQRVHEAEDQFQKSKAPADAERVRAAKDAYADQLDKLEAARDKLHELMRREILSEIPPIDIPRRS